MTSTDDVYVEKWDQAKRLLQELGVDAWLILVRETAMGGDPSLALMGPFDLTWESALLLSARGDRIAIVGRFDAQPVEESGLFDEVVGYDAGIGPALRDALERLDPAHVAINYSVQRVAGA